MAVVAAHSVACFIELASRVLVGNVFIYLSPCVIAFGVLDSARETVLSFAADHRNPQPEVLRELRATIVPGLKKLN